MNKSNICWLKATGGYTWNPVTGCKHGPKECPVYKDCYARRMAQRLAGRAGYPADEPFRPTFHADRLDEPSKAKKPSRIFVVSMGDLWGEWVPDVWINDTLCACILKHTYFFLTKNPARCVRWGPGLCQKNNFWFGASASDQKSLDAAVGYLLKAGVAHRFLSLEPLLGPISDIPKEIDWIIIGAQTKPGIQPTGTWINAILDKAEANNIPVWCKDNLRRYWPDLPQTLETGERVENFITPFYGDEHETQRICFVRLADYGQRRRRRI